jgi:hypothetical protein
MKISFIVKVAHQTTGRPVPQNFKKGIFYRARPKKELCGTLTFRNRNTTHHSFVVADVPPEGGTASQLKVAQHDN